MDINAFLNKPAVKSFLSKVTDYSHVPVALFVFCVTTAYCFYTGKDLQPGYVSSLYAFYTFLGAHFGASQIWPDKPDSGAQS